MFKNIMKLCCYFWNNAIVNNSREQGFTINNIHIPTLIIDNSSSRKVRNFTYVARSNIQFAAICGYSEAVQCISFSTALDILGDSK
jgi:hypothetical protein